MAAWSNILRSTGEKVLKIGAILPKNSIQNAQIRNMGHGPRLFRIEPTRWQWHKAKDFLHFYVTIGVVPLTIITLWANIFVGPASLEEIPEGYTPKYWEYYRSPITRFFMRYFNPSPQELYERTMYHIYEESQRMKIIALQRKIKNLAKERKDYQEYYYIPYSAETYYENKEFMERYEAPLNEFTEEDKENIRREAKNKS